MNINYLQFKHIDVPIAQTYVMDICIFYIFNFLIFYNINLFD